MKKILLASIVLLVIGGFAFLLFSNNKTETQQTVVVPTQPAATIPPKKAFTEEEVKAFFDFYVEKQNSFDPAFLEYYADEYVLKTRRYYPKGEPADLQLTKAQIVELMPAAMELGKQRNDTNTYSDITYQITDEYAKVNAKRFNHYKKYSAEYYMILKKYDGKMKIAEEFTETRP